MNVIYCFEFKNERKCHRKTIEKEFVTIPKATNQPNQAIQREYST